MTEAQAPLKILHVTRAPVGGIFRHILDLTEGQVARGHHVGLICDSMTGGERAEAALAAIAPRLTFGVTRYAIARELTPLDVVGMVQVSRQILRVKPDILHGHGAKGGAFLRLTPAAARAIRVYTPHGGSLHYGPSTLRGIVYSRIERILKERTDLFLFESAFARDRYYRLVGHPRSQVHVVHNGVGPAEFEPIAPAADATDLVYVGEFRRIKGADVLIDALAHLHGIGRKLHLTLAGDGEETDALHAQIARLKLTDYIRFIGHVPARTGFSHGHLLIVPSRGDSLPYVVIEAAAAGVPMLAVRVGGIPEIFGPQAARLVRPEDPPALAQAIAAALDDPGHLQAQAATLREHVRAHFSQDAMVEGVLAAYAEVLAARGAPRA